MHREVVKQKKFNIVIAETNLTRKNRDKWFEILDAHGYDVKIVEFPIEYEDAVMRDMSRKYSVGASVISKQYGQWLTYLEDK